MNEKLIAMLEELVKAQAAYNAVERLFDEAATSLGTAIKSLPDDGKQTLLCYYHNVCYLANKMTSARQTLSEEIHEIREKYEASLPNDRPQH